MKVIVVVVGKVVGVVMIEVIWGSCWFCSR